MRIDKVQLPQMNTSWAPHLNERVKMAVQIGLLKDENILAVQNGYAFIPDSLSSNDVSPEQSLNELISKKGNNKEIDGWVKRTDLIFEISQWIKNTFSSEKDLYLVCDADISRPGDKILEKRPHIIYHDRVFLRTNIKEADVESIAQIIRWARGNRLLGLVVHMTENKFDNSVVPQVFICDSLDGDSLIMCNVSGLKER